MNITKLHPHNRALELKQIWDAEDTNLYIAEVARYTAAGLNSYWKAIDRTIKFYDSILNLHEDKRIQNSNCSFQNAENVNQPTRKFLKRELQQYRQQSGQQGRPRQNNNNNNPQDLRFKLPKTRY